MRRWSLDLDASLDVGRWMLDVGAGPPLTSLLWHQRLLAKISGSILANRAILLYIASRFYVEK